MSWLNAEASSNIDHISHFRCVPTPNVLVERRSISKHRSHISHLSCVPLRNVAVECTFTTKALKYHFHPSTHIFHQTRIPIRHRPVPNVFRSSPDYTFSSLSNRCRFIQTIRDKSMPARVWNWRGTYARIRRTGDGVGALKFRLKRRSVEKHVSLRRRRCGSSPRGNVLVERRSGIKHIFISVTCAVFQLPMSWLNAEANETYIHISHLRCVPTPNVLVEAGNKTEFISSLLCPTPSLLKQS